MIRRHEKSLLNQSDRRMDSIFNWDDQELVSAMYNKFPRSTFPSRLNGIRELLWSVQEFLASFSRRGWVKRLPAAEGLTGVLRHLLDSLPPSSCREQLVNPDLVHDHICTLLLAFIF